MIDTGRKPVSVAPKNRKLVWKVIRELKTFTLRDIENKVKVKNSTIFSYLKALEKAQILNKEVIYQKEKGCLRTNVYTLVKDMGAMAPVVNKNGCLVEDSHQARIWRAIRILKNFTLKDIVLSPKNIRPNWAAKKAT